MSHQVERDDGGDVLDPESGLDAGPGRPDFRDPAGDPPDDHLHRAPHYALIYEDKRERYAVVVPFIKDGLEGGERCIYVVDERTTEQAEAVEALRDAGVDVDGALERGDLEFYTAQETYLRTEPFDPESMIDFYDDAIDELVEEYEGLRVVAGTDWIEEVPLETFMKYEGQVNALFEARDATALCMYDRRHLPASIIRDVIRTHPLLIYDGVVCHNFYYTPPEELFNSGEADREVDRLLGTLHDRAQAKADVAEHKQFLHELNEITASPDLSFEEKLHALFDLGCEWFDLELGALNRVDTESDQLQVEYINGDHEYYKPGAEFPLSQTYCIAAADIKDAASVSDPVEEGFEHLAVFKEFGVQSYLGTYIPVEGDLDRTFAFIAPKPPEKPFTEEDRTCLELMGQWVKYALERRQRERFLRVCHEITADPTRSFEDRLKELLKFGCEWFDLEMAGLNHLPSWDGKFQLEKGVGLEMDTADRSLWTDPGEGCFCRQAITEDTAVSQRDVRDTEWAEDSIYRDFGLTSYLGAKVTVGSTLYGTLWFGSTEPRQRPFSDTEHAFIELMGQWVSYEIHRREHEHAQRELYEIAADPDRTFEEKLQAVFELGCDRFGLDVGGIARVDPEADVFEVEAMRGDHGHLSPGAEYPLSETYCRPVAVDGGTVAITDPERAGFEGKLCYEQFGVQSYLGTRLELDGTDDRTFWFVSGEPRENDFSEAERTFHHLMGQWVTYEFERQQRERELRERTEHLSTVVETAPDCIKTVAPDGTVLEMNRAGLDLGEADAESDVIGECVYDFIAPEDRERYRAFTERVCQGERGTLEFDIIGLEGTRRHLKSHGAPLHRPDGTTIKVAVTRDITEKVEREQQLKESVDRLRQTNNRLEQFAYAASHDLQEPLRMVSSYLRLLEDQYRDELDADAKEYIGFAVDGADRMRAMVDDLLVFSQVEQSDGAFEPVDCTTIIERVRADLQVQIEEANAEVTVESLPTVTADPEQLEQLFSNLVSNAIKYNAEPTPRVEITARERDDAWEIAVADNGIGIEPAKTDQIFEVFNRLHHDDEYPGTGIGLSLCQEIVENHGGDIRVESTPGEGSTFIMTLPDQTAD